MAIIDVQHLSARYEEELILDDISFSVKPGSIFAITGPSGCGKTTLMNHLIGLLSPTAGDIRIEGMSLVEETAANRQALLQRIGVMYQSGALFSSMTLAENIMLPLSEWTTLPKAAREQLAMQKLSMVGLAAAFNKYPAQISGGMNKRAAIARAIALDPAVVFLDEPSAGLDPVAAYELNKLILTLSRHLGITFVMITHEVASILTLADDMILLRDKKIFAWGTPHELRHSKETLVRDFFEKGLADIHE